MPHPNTDLTMPATAQTLFLALAGALLAVGLVIGIRNLIRDRDPVLLYCLLGGAFASLLEPFVGVLGLMYIPQRGADVVFTFFGRGMPLFVPIAYAGYIGGLAYVAYRYFQGGISPTRILRIWAVYVVANIGFESPAVLLGVYSYYGNQPLNPWGFPLWWGFVNSLTSIVAGVLLLHLHQKLQQRNALVAVALLVPMSWGISNGSTAPPMWLALNSDLPRYAAWIAAVITLGLALFVVWLLGTLAAHPAQSARREHPVPTALAGKADA